MVLPNVDLGTLLLISVGLVFLCVAGLLIFFGLQFIGNIVGVVLGVFELIGNIIGGGPVSWCGCLVFLFVCFGCAGLVLIANNCSANPQAMNFCQLFAR